ncbi:MAG: serine protease [Desulfobacteraceae bacterium]|nr:serine protease [Desulfobacteraceae bacterium]MBC2757773.1 serine protease [Desulfobacteraceae bacterium]MBC2763867.1 serine protease [ANME-2 cluster archaeon]
MRQFSNTGPIPLGIFILLTLALGVVFSPVDIGFADSEAPASKQAVYVISVSGEVDPGMAAFIDRAVQDISKDPDGIVVANIDTFGGRVDSALEIVDTFLKIPENQSIAFVEKKAISAGALIALSCGELVMIPATTIGDCAPITYSQEGPEMLGEKFQSPIRAKFRALAKRNGYPVKLAEAMVSLDKEIYEVVIDGKKILMDASDYADLTDEEKQKITLKKTVVEKGELLTMHAEEAVELGFSKMTADSIADMLGQMGIENYEVIHIEQSWSESMVRFIGRIAPILMMIGLAALYMEMKAPGFGVPGIIGIICLAIVFLNQYMVGLADYTELLVIGFGIVLMGIEVFVLPGFGIAGFAGIVFLAVGLILSLQGFVLPDPSVPWQLDILINNVIEVVGALIASFLVGLFFLRYVLPQFSFARQGPFLAADLKSAHADSSETRKVSVGDKGIAMTLLRPSGKMKINGDIIDVVTENEFMEKGTLVVVSAIKGNRIIVSNVSGVSGVSGDQQT